jgi:hypothetical protein
MNAENSLASRPKRSECDENHPRKRGLSFSPPVTIPFKRFAALRHRGLYAASRNVLGSCEEVIVANLSEKRRRGALASANRAAWLLPDRFYFFFASSVGNGR